MKSLPAIALVIAAFAGGHVWGQGGGSDPGPGKKKAKESIEERLKKVRREVKTVELDAALQRLPVLFERENKHRELIAQMKAKAAAGETIRPLIAKAHALKTKTLADCNEILRLHKGEHVGLKEPEVWRRLIEARFADVSYEEEWLVNILDDIEESVGINIELDARIYKYDTVSFDFEQTSARAMLQMMGDVLLFKWLIRGDTLYVYKERNEILFGGEWLRARKKAWRERQKALKEAEKKADREARKKSGS